MARSSAALRRPPSHERATPREFDRQREWRESARRAIQSLHADEGTAPVPEDEDEDDLEARGLRLGLDGPATAEGVDGGAAGGGLLGHRCRRSTCCGFGVSRKRLEQAVRELQLPVVVVREADDADVVITLRNYYKQKPPALREAEERDLPIYVLKSNTILQMEACLTSLYALEVDPREAALREVEEAIGLVMRRREAGRAVAPERLHPPPAAPDGRARQPGLTLTRPRAVPPRPPLSRSGARLALTRDRQPAGGARASRSR